jgi:hypothetical protein
MSRGAHALNVRDLGAHDVTWDFSRTSTLSEKKLKKLYT